jgi:hypothetical protein
MKNESYYARLSISLSIIKIGLIDDSSLSI